MLIAIYVTVGPKVKAAEVPATAAYVPVAGAVVPPVPAVTNRAITIDAIDPLAISQDTFPAPTIFTTFLPKSTSISILS